MGKKILSLKNTISFKEILRIKANNEKKVKINNL